MLRFYYEPRYKYTNRTIIDVSDDNWFKEIAYENIDSPDTINGHIIYTLQPTEKLPTYIVDQENGWRWFVSGITQLRTGKFQISLLRDIISENPNLWKQEEAYITAGLANDYNKYKRWDLPFTNTKVGEQRLNINGKSSFFVYYVNQQHFSNGFLSEQDLKINSASVPGITGGFDFNVSDLNIIPGFEFVNAGNVYNYPTTIFDVDMEMPTKTPTVTQNGNTTSISYTSNYTQYTYNSSQGTEFSITDRRSTDGALNLNALFVLVKESDFDNNVNNIKQTLKTTCLNYVNNWQNQRGTQISSTAINQLEGYIGKTIYNKNDNKVYRINKSVNQNNLRVNLIPDELTQSLKSINWPYTNTSVSDYQKFHTSSGGYLEIRSVESVYTYTLEELGTATSFDFTFIANQRKLPKSAVRCVNIVESEGITNESITQALMLAQTNGINEDNTTGRILDIQYLPFSIATTTNNNLKINNEPLVAQFLDFDDYRFTTDLPDLTNINKETDTIKIVSPSRASQFLFNPYDNDGNMLFETKITLKPFASVIYVRPSTKGLLLEDWDDKDCLIIQEDFSLTNVTSQWTEYVYNNRTYLNAFERQIQGREFERSWEKRIEKAQAKSDEWTATQIHADKMKTYTGNIPIFSNLVAGIGAIAGVKDQNYLEAARTDRAYNEALYQEGLDLSRDMFDMQIENIRSQPLVPSKVTTIDCKFLDGIYLEFYSTNQTELAAIKNFYRYNGNRIDAYGTFAQYYGWFVRGKIIKSIYYTQPEIEELNRRLSMGIFTEVNYD